MFDEKTVRRALAAKDQKIEEMLMKEKERMARSIREAHKYFIEPDKKTFLPKDWGWEEVVYNAAYCVRKFFIKKGKKNKWKYDEGDLLIAVDSGKLHVMYSTDDDLNNACEIVLTEGDAFHCSPLLRRQEMGLLDTTFTITSLQRTELFEKELDK